MLTWLGKSRPHQAAPIVDLVFFFLLFWAFSLIITLTFLRLSCATTCDTLDSRLWMFNFIGRNMSAAASNKNRYLPYTHRLSSLHPNTLIYFLAVASEVDTECSQKNFSFEHPQYRPPQPRERAKDITRNNDSASCGTNLSIYIRLHE